MGASCSSHMFIHRQRKKDGTSQYTLRASERKGARIITRHIAYLGTNPQEILDKLHALEDLKSEVKNSYRQLKRTAQYERYLDIAKTSKLKKPTLLTEEDFFQAEAARLHYQAHIFTLNTLTRTELLEAYSYDNTWNSSSIEGNTISLDGATKYFTEKIMPKNAHETEVHDLRNGQEACMKVLLEHDTLELSHELIQDLHMQLVKGIDKRVGYRNHEVRITGSTNNTSPAHYIKEDMTDLLEWYEEHKETLHALELAAIFHARFESIHPFSDGNGRTGRLLINLILLKAGYPPLTIAKKNRANYLSALRSAQKKFYKDNTDWKELLSYLSAEYAHSYWKSFE
jgi:Fic family protein